MAKIKYGIHGATIVRLNDILGTVVVCNGTHNNIKGEIVSKNDYKNYLTVQIPSEFRNRVYILNLLYGQCKDIEWRSVY